MKMPSIFTKHSGVQNYFRLFLRSVDAARALLLQTEFFLAPAGLNINIQQQQCYAITKYVNTIPNFTDRR